MKKAMAEERGRSGVDQITRHARGALRQPIEKGTGRLGSEVDIRWAGSFVFHGTRLTTQSLSPSSFFSSLPSQIVPYHSGGLATMSKSQPQPEHTKRPRTVDSSDSRRSFAQEEYGGTTTTTTSTAHSAIAQAPARKERVPDPFGPPASTESAAVVNIKDELKEAKTELKEAEAKLDKAKTELDKAEAKLKEAKSELKEAKRELKEARESGVEEDISRAEKAVDRSEKAVDLINEQVKDADKYRKVLQDQVTELQQRTSALSSIDLKLTLHSRLLRISCLSPDHTPAIPRDCGRELPWTAMA